MARPRAPTTSRTPSSSPAGRTRESSTSSSWTRWPTTRRVVELGHQARGEAGIKLRQPLRRAYVRGANGAAGHAGELSDELNVKEIVFDDGPVVRSQLKPNLPVLGPRLGPRLPAVKAALDAGDYEELEGGGVRVAGEELVADEVLHGEGAAVEGFAIAQNGALSIALDTTLDEELIREGRVRDLNHRINAMRREHGHGADGSHRRHAQARRR